MFSTKNSNSTIYSAFPGFISVFLNSILSNLTNFFDSKLRIRELKKFVEKKFSRINCEIGATCYNVTT